MTRTRILVIAAALLAPSFIGSATAQTEQTAMEKAWATCLAQVNRTTTGSGNAQDRERVAAFKACMARLGFNP